MGNVPKMRPSISSFIYFFIATASLFNSIIFAFPIPLLSSSENDIKSTRKQLVGRRAFCCSPVLPAAIAHLLALLPPKVAKASNLPKSNGADQSRIGSTDTLVPLVIIRNYLQESKNLINNTNNSLPNADELLLKISNILEPIPNSEQKFKKLFDQYSVAVSYKQKFLDQNAFLVYYTRGFDGPNRPSIESSSDEFNNVKQTLQYGARNDAWTAMEDVYATLQYATADIADLKESIQSAIAAMDKYLALAPAEQLAEAQKQIQSKDF